MPDWVQSLFQHGNEFSEILNLLEIKEIPAPPPSPPPSPPRRHRPSPPRVRGPRHDVSKLYQDLLQVDEPSLITNGRRFKCPICLDECGIGTGIVLRGCSHSFCLECAREQIKHANEAEVKCPLVECKATYQDREIRDLLPKEEYERYLDLSLLQAAKRMGDAYHCMTPNCPGFCVKPTCSAGETIFRCPKCKKCACVMCEDPHYGMSCKDYRIKKDNDKAAKEDKKAIDGFLAQRVMVKCPSCGILVERISGCDNMFCTSCKRPFNWASAGMRQ